MEDPTQTQPEAPQPPPPAATQAPPPQALPPRSDYIDPGYAQAPTRSPLQKSPLLAAFLSFMPGLGNIYNGLYVRGISFFLIWGGIFALTIRTGNRSQGDSEALALFIPAVVFIWLFNLFDAYRQASLINHGYATDLGLEDNGRLRKAPGGMALGVVVLLIGVYGALERIFDFDLSLILEFWYVAFIAFGAWLIYQARLAKSQNAQPASLSSETDDAY